MSSWSAFEWEYNWDINGWCDLNHNVTAGNNREIIYRISGTDAK